MLSKEKLQEKMRRSSLAAFDSPEGGYLYRDYCIVPGSTKYFASEEEVDEFYEIAQKAITSELSID